ncbi:MAG: radical SAM protein [Planctomycetes bacterium]|nr:radical SAM protein [Planctomycetota bacterium]
MKILFFGLTGFGNAALRSLRRAGLEIAAVVTRKEAGPHPYYAERDLAEEARALGVPVYESPSLDDPAFWNHARDAAPDLVFVSSYHERVPYRYTSLGRLGGVEFVPAPLPRYRSNTPTTWVLVFGETETAITLRKAAAKMDAGDILAQEKIAIAPYDTDGTLRHKLAELSEGMIEHWVRKVVAGEPIRGTPQPEHDITQHPPRTKRDALIKFDEPTLNVHNRIRGTNPYPGAYTLHDGREVRIVESAPVSVKSYEVTPGLVQGQEDAYLLVKTKDGQIRIRTEPALTAAELARPLVLGQEARPALVAADVGASPMAAVATTRETYGIEPGAEEFPKMVVLAVAYPCNAKCPNCPYTETNSDIRMRYADASYIKPVLFHKIADECGKFGAFLRITGGGEPMMHPDDMVKLIEYARKAGARVWLNTNGSFFTPEKCERLLTCEIDQIEFSVDAADPTTYAIVRAGLDWDKLLETVKYMVRRRNERKSRTNLVVSVIQQEIVKNHLKEIEQFWLGLGLDEVIKRKFLTWGANTKLDPEKTADASYYLDKSKGEPCPFPFHRLNIDTRGTIEVCGYDITGRTNFGTVKDKTIQEIWKGPEFTWWRQMHAERRGGEIPLCRECPDWQYRSWTHNWQKVLKNASAHREGSVRDQLEASEVAIAAEQLRHDKTAGLRP